MTTNKETGVANLGSWGNIWFVRDNYPCILGTAGAETAKLLPTNYALLADSATASNYDSLDLAGNCMSAIPLCYVKRYEKDNYEYVIICEEPYDDTYKAYAHTDKNGVIKPYAYHAMFKGVIASDRLRSIGGQNLSTGGGCKTTATAERNAATAYGDGFDIRTWALQSLIADLCTLISKSDDSQRTMGQGYTTGGGDGKLGTTGWSVTKGQFFGTSVTTADDPTARTNGVKVFHIEDFWGTRWDRIIGLANNKGVYMAKMTPEGSVGYSFDNFSDYVELGKAVPAASATFIKDTLMTEYGRVPVAGGGSDSTYTCVAFWSNNGQVDIAFAGGGCAYGSWCGSRCLNLYNLASQSSWTFGASLTYV